MTEMLQKLSIYLQGRADESGATGVEYGMMVALIAAVIVAVVAILGTQVRDAFQTIVDAL